MGGRASCRRCAAQTFEPPVIACAEDCSSQASKLHQAVPLTSVPKFACHVQVPGLDNQFNPCGPPNSVTEVEAFATSLKNLHQTTLEAREAVITLETDHDFTRRTNEVSWEHVRDEFHDALTKSGNLAEVERLQAKEVAFREELAAYEAEYIEKLASAKQLVTKREFAKQNIQRCLDEAVERRLHHLSKADASLDILSATGMEGDDSRIVH